MRREQPSGQETPEQDGVALRALPSDPTSDHQSTTTTTPPLLLLLLAFWDFLRARQTSVGAKGGRAMASLVNSVCRLFVPVALLLSE